MPGLGEVPTATIDGASLRPLASNFAGDLIQPHNAGFDAARQIWNGHVQRRRALIARCRGTADVIVVVRYRREHGLPASVRGGGHAGAGHAICDCGVRAVEANGAAMNRSGGLVQGAAPRAGVCKVRQVGQSTDELRPSPRGGLKQPRPRTLNRWAWKFGQLVMSSWVQFSPASRRSSADRSAAILACSVRWWRRSTSLRAAGSPAVRNARMSGSGGPACFACTIDATRNRSSRV
jgi:hypothetical protein